MSANPAGKRQRWMYQTLAVLLASACAAYVIMPRRVPASGADDDPGRPQQTTQELRSTSAQPAPGTPGNAVSAGDPASSGRVAEMAANARPVTPRRKDKDQPVKPEDDPNEVASQLKHMGKNAGDVTAAEYIQALHDAGIHEGIGAFNPPGTSPPLDGLAVPEDYQLPDGYVRHYQTTDDGQAIEPILMYSPDFEFFDANGNPVPIPENRVVPADKAPPGFPIRPIQMPPKRQPGDLSR